MFLIRMEECHMDYQVLKKNFEDHRFRTSYFETKEEAAAYLKEQIRDTTVGFGGSVTSTEMGLMNFSVRTIPFTGTGRTRAARHCGTRRIQKFIF